MLQISPRIINGLKSDINHSKEYFLLFPSTSKLVKKTRLHLVFPTNFSVFRNRRKHSSSCLIYYLEHWEQNIKLFLQGKKTIISLKRFPENTRDKLEKIGQFFQVTIHFHPDHLQTKMINTSYCALVGLLLTILNNYFNVSIDTNMFFWLFKVILKIGDTAPLSMMCPLNSESMNFFSEDQPEDHHKFTSFIYFGSVALNQFYLSPTQSFLRESYTRFHGQSLEFIKCIIRLKSHTSQI